MREIEKYSNPIVVRELVNKYLGKDTPLYLSTRKDKKYMVRNPEGKFIHFGQMLYEDYTKHMSKRRRDLFRKRNHKWANADKWTPAWLSYYLLW
jgi:hypothetical protein